MTTEKQIRLISADEAYEAWRAYWLRRLQAHAVGYVSTPVREPS